MAVDVYAYVCVLIHGHDVNNSSGLDRVEMWILLYSLISCLIRFSGPRQKLNQH